MLKCLLASKHACDPVWMKTTTLPTTSPARCPPGNNDGDSCPQPWIWGKPPPASHSCLLE